MNRSAPRSSPTSLPSLMLPALALFGMLCLGLLGWSMKNFRYGTMTLDEVYRERHLNERPRRHDRQEQAGDRPA